MWTSDEGGPGDCLWQVSLSRLHWKGLLTNEACVCHSSPPRHQLWSISSVAAMKDKSYQACLSVDVPPLCLLSFTLWLENINLAIDGAWWICDSWALPARSLCQSQRQRLSEDGRHYLKLSLFCSLQMRCQHQSAVVCSHWELSITLFNLYHYRHLCVWCTHYGYDAVDKVSVFIQFAYSL